MGTYRPDLDNTPSTPDSVAALARQLRDGPLQELIDLQHEVAGIAARTADPTQQLEDLERLVRVALAAMEHFHVLTHELKAAIVDLIDATVDSN